MTHQELTEMGFTFEQLPSGRFNIVHKNRFKLNGFLCLNATRGCWFRTIEQKTLDDTVAYIKSIEF